MYQKKWLFGSMRADHPLVVSANVEVAYRLRDMFVQNALIDGGDPKRAAVVLNLNNPETIFVSTIAEMQEMFKAVSQPRGELEVFAAAFRYVQKVVASLNEIEEKTTIETREFIPEFQHFYEKEEVRKTQTIFPNMRHLNRLRVFPRVIIADKAVKRFSYRQVAAPLIAGLLTGRYVGEAVGFAYPGPNHGPLQMTLIDKKITSEASYIAAFTSQPWRVVNSRVKKGDGFAPSQQDFLDLREFFLDRLADGTPVWPGRIDTDLSEREITQHANGYATNGWDEDGDDGLDHKRRYTRLTDRNELGREPGIRLSSSGNTIGREKSEFNDPAVRLEMNTEKPLTFSAPERQVQRREAYHRWVSKQRR
ncbi:MAG: hypothetical protein NTV33_10890 [Coprothermobacterota bacterium]|nr:hypothetical protein [Coprothermobacterota bacterium]